MEINLTVTIPEDSNQAQELADVVQYEAECFAGCLTRRLQDLDPRVEVHNEE